MLIQKWRRKIKITITFLKTSHRKDAHNCFVCFKNALHSYCLHVLLLCKYQWSVFNNTFQFKEERYMLIFIITMLIYNAAFTIRLVAALSGLVLKWEVWVIHTETTHESNWQITSFQIIMLLKSSVRMQLTANWLSMSNAHIIQEIKSDGNKIQLLDPKGSDYQ